MAEFSVRWTGLYKSSDNFSGFASDVRRYGSTIKNKGNGLAFSSDVSEKINGSIEKIYDSLQTCAGSLNRMSSVLSRAAAKYNRTEAALCGNSTDISGFTSGVQASGNTLADILSGVLKTVTAFGAVTVAWAIKTMVAKILDFLGNVVKATNDTFTKWFGKGTTDTKGNTDEVMSESSDEDTPNTDTSAATAAAGGTTSGGNATGVEQQAASSDAKSMSSETFDEIVNKIGTQTNNNYGYTEAANNAQSSYMCSAYCISYVRAYLYGDYSEPLTYWDTNPYDANGSTGAQWGSSGGTVTNAGLSDAKSAIDSGKPAIIHLSSSSSSTHYVVAIGYSGDGSSLSNYTCVDPWDGKVKNMGETNYSLNSDNQVIIY